MHLEREFIDLHGKIEKPWYPEHEKYIDPLREIWLKSEDVDLWIDQSSKYLKKVFATDRGV